MPEVQDDGPLTITVDGEKFTMDDLTFRERKAVRSIARELDGDPDVAMDDVMFDDLVLAFATVCKRRANPEFSLDDALDLKFTDLSAGAAKPARPTRAKAAAK